MQSRSLSMRDLLSGAVKFLFADVEGGLATGGKVSVDEASPLLSVRSNALGPCLKLAPPSWTLRR